MNNQRLAEQQAILAKDIKGWNDQMTQETIQMFRDAGFNDREISDSWDARALKVVREWNALKKENRALKEKGARAAAAAKKIKRTVPKAHGKGSTVPTPSKKNKKVLDLKKRLKEHDSIDNATALITEIMNS